MKKNKNEISAEKIYSLISTLIIKVDDLGDRITSLEGRVSGLEDRITSLEVRVTGLEERVTGLEGRITSLEEKVISLEGRITKVEEGLINVENKITDCEARDNNLRDMIHKLNKNMNDQFEKFYLYLDARLEPLDKGVAFNTADITILKSRLLGINVLNDKGKKTYKKSTKI